jgi:uncharacterized NAD(P)/FAD-binding protein YdhS
VLLTTDRDIETGRDRETVAVVGGGCAGILVAAHLLRLDRRPRHIVIFEPRHQLGAGAAFSTDDRRHLLNAPAASMSAFEDDPAHFVAWLASRDLGFGAADFVPRHRYRDYLQDVLDDEIGRAAPGTEVTWVPQMVTSVEVGRDSERPATTVRFGHGKQCRVDAVVLALGAPAPVALSSLDVSPSFGMIRDPWCSGALDATIPTGDVLVLGTGLTMVDVAMVLTDGDQRRTVHARSRHGLLPAEHASDGFAPWPGFEMGQPATAREVLCRLRRMTAEAEAAGWNWRNVIAAARSAAPTVWGGLPETERRRLLRHLARRWEVSRHRMSTPVAAAVADLRRSGRLTVGAGRVLSVDNEGSVGDPRLRVTLAGPCGRRETLVVSTLIDCTGPGPDPTAGSPLIAGLVQRGLARIHPSGIGLDVDEHGDLRTGTGAPGTIHCVGWCRRGAEFEATAVPEIRRQANLLARHMAEVTPTERPVLVHA